jgi:DNA-binding PadR family transcriptional regulator
MDGINTDTAYIEFISRPLSLLIILNTLSQDKEHSGYSLVKRIKERTVNKLTFRAGTVYSHIEQLSADGLITQDIRELPTRKGLIRQKAVYSITPKGRDALERMLKQWYNVLATIDDLLI